MAEAVWWDAGFAQAKRLKELENENARLKKLVADLSLDNSILKEVTKGYYARTICFLS